MSTATISITGWTCPDGGIDVEIGSPSSSGMIQREQSKKTKSKQSSSERRRMKKKAEDPDWVPRPKNCFMIFRCEMAKKLKAMRESRSSGKEPQKSLSSRAGMDWHNLPEEEKERYKRLSEEEVAEHARRYPHYRFQPVKKYHTGKNKRNHPYPRPSPSVQSHDEGSRAPSLGANQSQSAWTTVPQTHLPIMLPEDVASTSDHRGWSLPSAHPAHYLSSVFSDRRARSEDMASGMEAVWQSQNSYGGYEVFGNAESLSEYSQLFEKNSEAEDLRASGMEYMGSSSVCDPGTSAQVASHSGAGEYRFPHGYAYLPSIGTSVPSWIGGYESLSSPSSSSGSYMGGPSSSTMDASTSWDSIPSWPGDAQSAAFSGQAWQESNQGQGYWDLIENFRSPAEYNRLEDLEAYSAALHQQIESSNFPTTFSTTFPTTFDVEEEHLPMRGYNEL